MKRRSRHEALKSTLRNDTNVLSNDEMRPVKRHKPPRHSRPPSNFTAMNLQRRAISFSPKVETVTIANRQQLSAEERKERWITAEEFRRRGKENAKLIEGMIESSRSRNCFSKHCFFSCHSAATDMELRPPILGATASSQQQPPDHDSAAYNNDNATADCIRGLEKRTKVYLSTKLALRRLFHETIQRIDMLEKQDSKDYSETLAQLCQVLSETNLANALAQGARDAEEVGHQV